MYIVYFLSSFICTVKCITSVQLKNNRGKTESTINDISCANELYM